MPCSRSDAEGLGKIDAVDVSFLLEGQFLTFSYRFLFIVLLRFRALESRGAKG